MYEPVSVCECVCVHTSIQWAAVCGVMALNPAFACVISVHAQPPTRCCSCFTRRQERRGEDKNRNHNMAEY